MASSSQTAENFGRTHLFELVGTFDDNVNDDIFRGRPSDIETNYAARAWILGIF